MRGAQRGFFVLIVPLATLWAGTFAAASEEVPSSVEKGTAIEGLLAQKVNGAVCFSGKFTGHKVHVQDWLKLRYVPEPGSVQNGKPVMQPMPAIYLNQDIRALTLLIEKEEAESESPGFQLKLSMRGWRGPLYALGPCHWRGLDEATQAPGAVAPANTPALRCTVIGDGGSFDVVQVAGSQDVILRLQSLRMSGTRQSEGDYFLSATAKVYFREGEPDTRVPPVDFRLAPMPAKQCDAFRKAME